MAGYVRLLGSPAIRHEEAWLEPSPGKTSALLYYLAYADGWVSRGDLHYLLWPDTHEQLASQNLRPLLTKVRRLDYAGDLDIEPKRVRWQVPTDRADFRHSLAERRWAQAAQLYAGALLQGFELPDAPEFETWLELERHELHEAWREAVLALATELEATQRHAESSEVLGRLYQTEPLDEPVLTRYLLALTRAGRRHEALECYQSFSRLLRDELDGEPEPDTRDLAERIARGEPPPEPATPTGMEASQGRISHSRSTLPVPTTPFIGRDAETAQLRERLRDPACRLATIIGPGGMGKTRLAIEVASGIQGSFGDGIFYVTLSPAAAPEALPLALAGALDFTFFGSSAPQLQLLDYLRDKDLLLVLDNLEPQTAGTGMLEDILEAAPKVKVLATSRERLGLRAEWLFDLEGLSFPASSDIPMSRASDEPDAMLRAFDALELFVQCATRVRSDFMLAKTDFPALIRICHLVEGMPLALELAASWTRVLTPEEIAAEIELGLDLLQTSASDAPTPHHSIRALIESSWERLQEGEKAALRRLSTFRGGFTKEAAQGGAGVGLPLLLSLSNRSFLRRSRAGRFSSHPLLRRYAAEQARLDPEENEQANDLHSGYFMTFLAGRAGAFKSAGGLVALREIEQDFENVSAAWRHAASRKREEAFGRAVDALSQFCTTRGRFEQGWTLMQEALAVAPEGSLLQARLLSCLGMFESVQGRLDEGIDYGERGLALLERHDAKVEMAQALRRLGIVYSNRGEAHYDKARRAFRRAQALYREQGDAEGAAMMLNNRANVADDTSQAIALAEDSISLSREKKQPHALAMAQDTLASIQCHRVGDYPAALAAIQESLRHHPVTGNTHFLAAASGLRADILIATGDLSGARAQSRDLLDLAERLGPQAAVEWRSHAMSALAQVHYLQGELDEAAALCRQCLELGQRYPHGYEMARAHGRLARVALARGRPDEAHDHIEGAAQALEQPSPLVGWVLTAMKIATAGMLGEVRLELGDLDGANEAFRSALTQAHDQEYNPAALSVLVGLSRLHVQRGGRGRAARLLDFALAHPAASRETKDRVTRLIGELEPVRRISTKAKRPLETASVHEFIGEELAQLQGGPAGRSGAA